MSEPGLYRQIIAGESGAWSSPVRALLHAGSMAYGVAVGFRNRRYDRGDSSQSVPVPVLSVGNVTVGGTGKTPLVIDLVTRLTRMGRNPAVVSRGYKSIDGQPNDETRLIQQRCPGVVCAADTDRIAGSLTACRRFGADVIVLDDGFQHRALNRDLDIVLIDATCPFGYDHLLPRGLLREPVSSLRRAGVIVLTRCDQVSLADRARTERRLKRLAPQAVHLSSRHKVTTISRLDGTVLDDDWVGRRAVLFAGIARPSAFATTVRTLGIEVVGEHWWPDHHHYRPVDLRRFGSGGAWPSHDLLLTTEKDAVKLATLPGVDQMDIGVVNVRIDFEGDGGTILEKIIEDTLGRG